VALDWFLVQTLAETLQSLSPVVVMSAKTFKVCTAKPGKNSANPTALLLSAVHMLKHLRLEEYAQPIHAALLKVITEGKVLTPDVGGTSTTSDFTSEIIKKLRQ
jgi:isocitrate dehydrogenase